MSALTDRDLRLNGKPLGAVYLGPRLVWPRAADVLPPTRPSYSEVVTADNPTAYWRLGQAVGAVPDETGNGRPLNLTAGFFSTAPSLLPSGDGASTMFTNQTQTANTPQGIAPYGSASTFEVWARLTVLPSGFAYFCSHGVYFGVMPTGIVNIDMNWTGVLPKAVSKVPLQAGQVYHLVGTTTDNDVSHIYVNGVDVTGAVTTRAVPTGTGRVTVGGGQTMLQAELQEVAYYDYPLTPEQVRTHYQAALPDALQSPYAFAVWLDRPTAYYRLGESGANATDLVGGPSGSYAGVAAQAQPSLLPSGEGASTRFNNGAGVVIPDSPALRLVPSEGYSIEMWMRRNQLVMTVLMPQIYGFALSTNLSQIFQWVGGSVNVRNLPAPMGTTDAFHLVFTVAPGPGNLTANVYIDGALAAGNVWSRPPDVTTETGLVIGGPGGTYPNPYSGKLQEFALYDYPLTADQIARHYAAAQP